ncbi:cupin domain-containing protein [Glutamicibacter halophytocola]|uniref:cupin domain-containing protein n=1 Tax=Glutamicibacter halophytocola TaxID=1933880 RepID=UPI0015C5553B|nr:cupin domain-containing protein [Glutamicibacter halophytocola]NQD42244.1 cupin domain-containing protein [Glutamicibacter halophytocola]
MSEQEFDINKNVEIFSVNRAADLETAPGQTLNARRISGVSKENSAADKIWFGKVHTGPGEVSDPHHHGEAQTGGYVHKGRGFIRYGEGYSNIVYMEEGDFVFVPPYMPHIEGNASKTEELVWMTTRTPDNIVVNLENQDIADIEIDYRS